MWQKNHEIEHGKTGDLQNRFTAYALKAVRRKRQEYVRQLSCHAQMESAQESAWMETVADIPQELDEALPLAMRLENSALLLALKSLNERERDIFLSRVLDEQSFETLAARYGIRYKAAAEVYYRAVRKIRQRMGG